MAISFPAEVTGEDRLLWLAIYLARAVGRIAHRYERRRETKEASRVHEIKCALAAEAIAAAGSSGLVGVRCVFLGEAMMEVSWSGDPEMGCHIPVRSAGRIKRSEADPDCGHVLFGADRLLILISLLSKAVERSGECQEERRELFEGLGIFCWELSKSKADIRVFGECLTTNTATPVLINSSIVRKAVRRCAEIPKEAKPLCLEFFHITA